MARCTKGASLRGTDRSTCLSPCPCLHEEKGRRERDCQGRGEEAAGTAQGGDSGDERIPEGIRFVPAEEAGHRQGDSAEDSRGGRFRSERQYEEVEESPTPQGTAATRGRHVVRGNQPWNRLERALQRRGQPDQGDDDADDGAAACIRRNGRLQKRRCGDPAEGDGSDTGDAPVCRYRPERDMAETGRGHQAVHGQRGRLRPRREG